MSPKTVALCAVSKKLRPRAMTTSILLDCALLAASCAALRRATRCSGVSPASKGDGDGVGRPAGGGRDATAGAVPDRAKRLDVAVCGELEETVGEDILDSAWGVVDVNRVASETDRGPVVLIAILAIRYGR
jgi:hypothetical protein